MASPAALCPPPVELDKISIFIGLVDIIFSLLVSVFLYREYYSNNMRNMQL